LQFLLSPSGTKCTNPFINFHVVSNSSGQAPSPLFELLNPATTTPYYIYYIIIILYSLLITNILYIHLYILTIYLYLWIYNSINIHSGIAWTPSPFLWIHPPFIPRSFTRNISSDTQILLEASLLNIQKLVTKLANWNPYMPYSIDLDKST